MRRFLVVCSALILIFAANAGFAATNELVNGDFELGFGLDGWTVTPGGGVIAVYDVPDPGVGYYATCNLVANTFDAGAILSQVVDESQFPGWIPKGTSKTVDVTSRIWMDARTGIRFRLGSWSSYSGDANPLTVPGVDTAVQYTDWVAYTNTGSTNSGWLDAHPFNNYLYRDYQPRWVQLQIQFLQPAGTFGRVDNVVLTGKCNDPNVPEPISVLLGSIGFAVIGGLRRFKK